MARRGDKGDKTRRKGGKGEKRGLCVEVANGIHLGEGEYVLWYKLIKYQGRREPEGGTSDMSNVINHGNL